MRVWGIVALSVALAGCGPEPKMLWLLSDGQRVADNSALKSRFDFDGATCREERTRANLSNMTVASGGLASIAAAVDRSSATDDVQQRCMAEKGYLLVQEDQASAKQAELMAAAEQERQQEAAQAAQAAAEAAKKSAPKKRSSSKAKPTT